MAVAESRFRVMASDAHVILVEPSTGAIEWAEQRLRQLEALWSRFVATSDISRLNRATGGWTAVDGSTITLIGAMQEASRKTAGRYDPTMLYELLEAGYDTSVDDKSQISVMVNLPCPGHTISDVVVDTATSSVLAPPDVGLDPGGIGKGLAADLVAAELVSSGTRGALVSIGGDLAATGRSPSSGGWQVTVEDPHRQGAALTTLEVSGGGIATSSTLSRRWIHHGAQRHHVIDPATRRNSSTDIAAVTVVAMTGWLAEIHATAAVIHESSGAIAYLSDRGLTGVVTTVSGSVATTADLVDVGRSVGAAR